MLGLDIGTHLTKATKDGQNVVIFPSLVISAEEREWSLGRPQELYIGDDALRLVGRSEDLEILRPLQDGRILHEAYVLLAKYALTKLDLRFESLTAQVQGLVTGTPVRATRAEREELKQLLSRELNTKVTVVPQPVGTLAHLGIENGVCIDIGYGTTDVVVLDGFEFLKGDTILAGVDRLFENLDIAIRRSHNIALTSEELLDLILGRKSKLGKIRGARAQYIGFKDFEGEYKRLLKDWISKLEPRIKRVLEGVSTDIVQNLVLSGGGSLLPGVRDEFVLRFEEIGSISFPDNPITSNVLGFHKLAQKLYGERAQA